MPKVYAKQNFGTNPQADIESMVAIDNGIDVVDTRTQNLPDDGNFNLFTPQDVPFTNNQRVEWLGQRSGKYYIDSSGTEKGYPATFSVLEHTRIHSSLALQVLSRQNGIWTRTLNANDNSLSWTKYATTDTAPRTYILKGKLPQTTWQNAITHNLPIEFQNFPVVLSVYYKNANGVWIPATPAEFSVMTGGNGSYLTIQTAGTSAGTSVVGLDFEVTVMSRSNAQIVTI